MDQKETILEITKKEIFFPFCLNKKSKARSQKYQILSNYVMKKICIKEYINSINENEKLKFLILDKNKSKIFESLPNYFPNSLNNKTIWNNNFINRNTLLVSNEGKEK